MKKLVAFLSALLLTASLFGCAAEPAFSTIPTVPEQTDACTIQTVPPAEVAEPASPPESAVASPRPAGESTFSVHFIDVGQADAALVECDGHYMLIDGGNRTDSDKIYSVLKQADVPVLDLVVGTHAHEDHIGGIPGAFNWTTAEKTLCPVTSFDSKAFENFARYASRYGGGITVPEAGDTYSLGSALVTILGLNNGTSTNDSSIVLRLDYGSTSFLFPGDAEFDAEKALLNTGAHLRSTVLKVGHHGSETSTNYAFLREVMPQYAVISCGAGNPYGHPAEAVLSRLRDAEVQVFRTDLQGDLICTSDGETVTFEVSRNARTDPPGLGGIPYVLNISSGKFHDPGCSSVKQMAPQNRKEVICTREELIAQGYVPCQRCHP